MVHKHLSLKSHIFLIKNRNIIKKSHILELYDYTCFQRLLLLFTSVIGINPWPDKLNRGSYSPSIGYLWQTHDVYWNYKNITSGKFLLPIQSDFFHKQNKVKYALICFINSFLIWLVTRWLWNKKLAAWRGNNHLYLMWNTCPKIRML